MEGERKNMTREQKHISSHIYVWDMYLHSTYLSGIIIMIMIVI